MDRFLYDRDQLEKNWRVKKRIGYLLSFLLSLENIDGLTVNFILVM